MIFEKSSMTQANFISRNIFFFLLNTESNVKENEK